MEHCCSIMTDYICREDKNSIIQYDSSTRLYTLKLIDISHGTHQIIKYCPWCGKKLPKELDEEWSNILEREYGIKEPGWKKPNELPKEFWTDEWWKKRGL